MIELRQDVPENVVAFGAKGKVTGDDYENIIIPAIEAKLKDHEKIRLLYQIGPDYTGYEASAMWDDTKVGMKHLTHFEKIAVVTDDKWMIRAVKAFGFMIRGEVRLHAVSSWRRHPFVGARRAAKLLSHDRRKWRHGQ